MTLGAGGEDVVDPRRDQSRRARATLQKRSQILLAPGIVDDQKDPAIAERLAQFRCGSVNRFDARTVTRQNYNEVRYDRQQVAGPLAEPRPENAVEIGLLNVFIMRQRFGERRPTLD